MEVIVLTQWEYYNNIPLKHLSQLQRDGFEAIEEEDLIYLVR